MSVDVGKEVLVRARVVMPESADGKDCLVEFRWHDGTVSRAWARHEDVMPARSFLEPGLLFAASKLAEWGFWKHAQAIRELIGETAAPSPAPRKAGGGSNE